MTGIIREATVADFNQLRDMQLQHTNFCIAQRPDIFKALPWWAVKEENFKEALEVGQEEYRMFVYAEGDVVLGYCQVDIEDETELV
jgi:hypothetical protein